MPASRRSAPRNNAYSLKWHRTLIEELGGCCVWCGKTTRLELDHIEGRTWKPSLVSWHRRIRRYRDEAAAGLLQVLCKTCNAVKGGRIEGPARKAAAAIVEGTWDPDTLPEWAS